MKRLFSITIIVLVFGACSGNKSTNTNNIPVTDSAINFDSTPVDNTQTQKDTSAVPAENRSILPGKGLGRIELGMNDSMLIIELGKPDMSDAAMGKAWLTWYGKRHDEHNNKTQLDVYTAYKDTTMREKTVQQVRTTSSFFAAENGLHVYSSLDDIENKFSQLKKVAVYNDSGRKIIIYDDRQQGIAFEIVSANKQKICTGIIIHQPGIKVTQTYISLHPGMHIL